MESNVELGEVIKFIRGITFKPDDQVVPLSEGSSVVMRTKNVQVAGLDQSDLIAVPSSFVKRQEQYLNTGDILISSANSWELVGKASYVPELSYQATAGGFISIIRAREKLIERRYLYHWITSPSAQHKIRHCGRQTTNISNLDVDRFKQLEIPLPPLAEQKRIAAILDKADAIRRKRQQAILLADEFLRATFLDMFGDPVTNPKGWEVKTLGEVALSFQNGIGKNKEHYGSGEKVANIGDLYDSSSFEPKKYSLLDVSPKEIEKYRLSKGDILFVRSSVKKEGVAYCSAYDSEELCLFSSFMIRMKIDNDKLLPNFLSVQLRTPSQRTCLINASNTATITNINQAGLSNVNIIIPTLEAQQQFIEKQRFIFATVEKIKSQLVSDDALFGSLSQRAFAGLL